MPGGNRGGGGIRGGGFHGGGIRSGGTPSFRSQSPHTTPFGRTGAQRTVTHGPSGPYFHTPISHPSSQFYPHTRRHWYGSYGYGIGGRYRRSGGIAGCCVFVVFLIIFASVFAYTGIFNDYSFGTDVNYDDYETLYSNDYWYESQYLSSGSDITFSMQSYSAAVTFLISDIPLTSLPTTPVNGKVEDHFSLNAKYGQNEYYVYEMIYLQTGSMINFNFNSSNSVDFFIANANNFNYWYNDYYYPSFYLTRTGVKTAIGTFTTSSTQDYYFVWHNPYATSTQGNYSISYTAQSAYDYSSTLYHAEAVSSISMTTVTVPNDGLWYFYIYLDPMNSASYSTSVSFDVTYAPISGAGFNISNLTYVVPIIIIIVVFIACVAIGITRSKAKARAQSGIGVTPVGGTITPPTTFPQEAQPPVQFHQKPLPTESIKLGTTFPTPEVTHATCFTCGAEITPGVQYCRSCGRKQQGRQLEPVNAINPNNVKNCIVCGADLEPGARFCVSCGTPIK